MKSDKEIVETFSVTLAGDVITFALNDEQSDSDDITRQAQLAKVAIMKYYDANPDLDYKGLINLMPLGVSARFLTPEAKQIYVDLVSLERMVKMAFVVPSKFARMLTGFFAQMSHKWGKTKWFTDEEEAQKWLDEY